MKDRIRMIRKDLNMNQTEFGSEIGATQKMVTTYETGAVLPDKSIRLLICEKFNVNPEWLETGEGVPYKEGLIPELAQALRSVEVHLADHMVFADEDCVSMAVSGYYKPSDLMW